MTTKWLTAKEVKAAGVESEEAAIACSLKHHEQIRATPSPELFTACTKELVGVGTNFCALCSRYMPFRLCIAHGRCPLYAGANCDYCDGYCCAEWVALNDIVDKWHTSVRCNNNKCVTYYYKELLKAEDTLIVRLRKELEICQTQKQ